MKTKFLFLTAIVAVLFLASCSKEDEPTPVVVKTTYNKDIKPILLAKCTPCHLAGGANPNKWDDFTSAKGKIDVIIERINREATATGFMPRNGAKLPAAELALIAKWKADGLLEN
ncbi:MAG: cytochrome c [Saprospiraceae bacterium]|jgi:outer membrane murein-binding lipoprotein Lpp|nr:cytochrome c [Saprospiraceae bacterium]